MIKKILKKALKEEIPFSIKDAAINQRGLRKTILRELHRITNVSKADIFDFMNKETEFKLNKDEVE
jgi:hypothetical protein